MTYSEVKKYKKTDKASLYIQFYRKIGLFLTWIIINIFPRLKANYITIFMLFMNFLSAYFLYLSISNFSLIFLFLYFLLINFSICLDCVDGNIARMNNESSIYGVFLDRLVHNISYPLLFFVIGFGIFQTNNSLLYLITFLIAGILTQLSPIIISYKDVDILLSDNIINEKNNVYNFSNYTENVCLNQENKNSKKSKKKKKAHIKFIKVIYTNIPLWNKLFLLLLFDILFFNKRYYLVTIFTLLIYIIRRIYKEIINTKKEIIKIYKKYYKLKSEIE